MACLIDTFNLCTRPKDWVVLIGMMEFNQHQLVAFSLKLIGNLNPSWYKTPSR